MKVESVYTNQRQKQFIEKLVKLFPNEFHGDIVRVQHLQLNSDSIYIRWYDSSSYINHTTILAIELLFELMMGVDNV